jgi:putative membrane protein (TIGR04086 family)
MSLSFHRQHATYPLQFFNAATTLLGKIAHRGMGYRWRRAPAAKALAESERFVFNCYNRGSFYVRNGSGKMSSAKIHWGRILLGGLLAEIALILAIVPLGLHLGENFLHYTAPPGSFVMCFLGALWVCRRIESHFILHGTLVGVVAALIYVGLTRAQPEPFAYIVAHALKLAGGACGGFVAQLRRSPSALQPVHDRSTEPDRHQ